VNEMQAIGIKRSADRTFSKRRLLVYGRFEAKASPFTAGMKPTTGKPTHVRSHGWIFYEQHPQPLCK
jgi:hypothetical protein